MKCGALQFAGNNSRFFYGEKLCNDAISIKTVASIGRLMNMEQLMD